MSTKYDDLIQACEAWRREVLQPAGQYGRTEAEHTTLVDQAWRRVMSAARNAATMPKRLILETDGEARTSERAHWTAAALAVVDQAKAGEGRALGLVDAMWRAVFGDEQRPLAVGDVVARMRALRPAPPIGCDLRLPAPPDGCRWGLVDYGREGGWQIAPVLDGVKS